MLLADFCTALEHQRELGEFANIDPDMSGREMAQALVVEIRVVLASQDPSQVELPEVGNLVRSGADIRFNPSELLKKDLKKQELKLKKFLQEKIGFSSLNELNDLQWLQKLPEPYVGLPILEQCGAMLLKHFARSDPRLEKVPWELVLQALCLVVHDSICCGTGIELETIGTFRDETYEADDLLKESIRHTVKSRVSSALQSTLKVSLLMDESLLPKQ